ncbi:ATP-grasp fold amidoligase family protein [Providencia hangzhouensis]|uniref:ATP-grasp fold amidoligase family protein n=1 Tax=Providencia hangzhouensis TaxID=3031799 RepID=UPI0034DCDE9A
MCRDKAHFDWLKAKNKLDFHLTKNLYYITRERHYKTIPAQIMCEEYIDLFANKNRKLVPETCRIHCFSGKPAMQRLTTQTIGNEFINIYDINWQLQPVTFGYPNMFELVSEPPLFKEMLRLAEILVTPFDYCINLMSDKCLISANLHLPNAGRTEISPLSWDFKLGELWEQRVVA